MSLDDDIEGYIADRNARLLALDLDWARNQVGPSDGVTLLMALHKARVNVTSLPEAARLESMAWLKERGLGPGFGNWPTDGSLPT